MTIQSLIQTDDLRLTKINKEISDFSSPQFFQLITDLTETMHDSGLVGIAAPQIGENFQVFITEPRQTATRAKEDSDILRIFCNPQIVYSSTYEVVLYEGCGSVKNAHIFGPVLRPREVTIKAQDKEGNLFTFTCDGLLARIIQHEMDHLNGTLFIDHVKDDSSLLTFEQYTEFKNKPHLFKK
jgi:peptide deformylase